MKRPICSWSCLGGVGCGWWGMEMEVSCVYALQKLRLRISSSYFSQPTPSLPPSYLRLALQHKSTIQCQNRIKPLGRVDRLLLPLHRRDIKHSQHLHGQIRRRNSNTRPALIHQQRSLRHSHILPQRLHPSFGSFSRREEQGHFARAFIPGGDANGEGDGVFARVAFLEKLFDGGQGAEVPVAGGGGEGGGDATTAAGQLHGGAIL